MEQYFSCECGNTEFKYFLFGKVLCIKCSNEYFYDFNTKEFWLRRWNLEKQEYNLNAEKINQ